MTEDERKTLAELRRVLPTILLMSSRFEAQEINREDRRRVVRNATAAFVLAGLVLTSSGQLREATANVFDMILLREKKGAGDE